MNNETKYFLSHMRLQLSEVNFSATHLLQFLLPVPFALHVPLVTPILPSLLVLYRQHLTNYC